MPPDEPPPLFSRDEISRGLSARRASTLLFAIEALTAQLAARERRAMATWVTERTAAEQEQAFLEALRAGRDDRHRPSIRDLERHAPAWATLVPPDPALASAVATRIAERHAFRREDVPGLRAALRLDDAATAAELERQRGVPSDGLYRAELAPAERFAWWRARIGWWLEDLPPFWAAFALTLTETIGGGVLAIPIALAAVGLVPSLLLVVAFGLVSTVTVAALVEAITRNGSIRYGTAYLGRLVGDYLGRSGVLALSVALLALNALVLAFALVGVGVALGAATAIPAVAWIALLFALDLAILRRDSFTATVASALVVGAVNVAIVVVLLVLALVRFDPANFVSRTEPLGGAFGLVFGVLLASYFGHTSAGNAAKVVLRRDPAGRSLLWGNVAAMLTVTGVYSLAVVGFNGAIPAATLAGFDGTVLEPLAERAGPAVTVLGSIFVVLGMGLGSIYFSLGLANQAREAIGGRVAPRSAAGFVARAAPAIAVFAAVELLVALGAASFTGVLSFLGALTTPIIGGVLPMLLVLAARRRGEYVPGTVIHALAHPFVVAAVSLVYLGGVVVHAMVVTDSVVERLASLAVAAAIVAVAARAVRGGAFRPRAVLELRREGGSADIGRYGAVVSGRPVDAGIALDARDGRAQASDGIIRGFDSLRAVTFRIDAADAGDLKVWTHTVTPQGDSVPLWADVHIAGMGNASSAVGRDGAVVVRLDGDRSPDGRVEATVRLVRGSGTP